MFGYGFGYVVHCGLLVICFGMVLYVYLDCFLFLICSNCCLCFGNVGLFVRLVVQQCLLLCVGGLLFSGLDLGWFCID